MEELKLFLHNGKNSFHGHEANGTEKNVIRAWLHPSLLLAASTTDPTKKAVNASLNGWGLHPTAGSGTNSIP